MKRKELEKELKLSGWWFCEHGGRHDQWTNGSIFESIPRHKEIGEGLARKIIKRVKLNPPIIKEE